MANHKSALKRIKQNEKRQLRNKAVKTTIRKNVKKIRTAMSENSVDTAKATLKDVQSVIDKASKKGVIHRNTAARTISRLYSLVNKAAA